MRKASLIFFLIVLWHSTAFAQEGLQQVRINDFSGGQNSNALADLLTPNQGTSVSNVSISRPGKATKRKGQGVFIQDVGSTPFTGLGRYDPEIGSSYIVVASGSSIVTAVSTASLWTPINLASPLSVNVNRTEFVQANDLFFILNGVDNTAWYDGSIFTLGNGYDNASPPRGTTAAWVNNRLFVAGDTSNPDWVYFSNSIEPRTFQANNIRRVNTGDGQIIQHLEPFRLNEVVIYKERSIYILDLTDDGADGDATDDWSIQPISNSVGLAAPRAIVNLGNDQWFLSSNPIAIRSLGRTAFDKILVDIVSRSIQDIFDCTGPLCINKEQIELATATVFENKFFLAIPTGSSTINNTVLVFDFLVGGWYVITDWFPADWVVFDNRLFYIDALDGRVMECFKDTGGDFASGPSVTTPASTPTVGIRFEYATKAVDFGLPENFKQLDSIEVELEPTGSYNAIVSINMDDSGWASVGSVSLAGTVKTLPQTLPLTFSGPGIARKTFQLQEYGEFKKIQVKVTQNILGEDISLQRISIFARIKPWRRQ